MEYKFKFTWEIVWFVLMAFAIASGQAVLDQDASVLFDPKTWVIAATAGIRAAIGGFIAFVTRPYGQTPKPEEV